MDYGISQYLNDKLEVGIYGGNNWQISDDKGDEVYWDAAVKDEVGVVGLQVGYWLWQNRLQVVGKYGVNYGAMQHFKQNTIGINVIFIANALQGKKATKPK